MPAASAKQEIREPMKQGDEEQLLRPKHTVPTLENQHALPP